MAEEKLNMRVEKFRKTILLQIIFIWIALGTACGQGNDPLPNWRETAHKRQIVAFVTAVSTAGSADFVPVEHRIAVFDMDGTLIVEKPTPVNFDFMLDYLRTVGEKSAPLRQVQPYKAVLENDMSYLIRNSKQVGLTAHMGYSEADYMKRALDFVKTHKHPKYNKAYIDLFYSPMVELIEYLHSNGFRVYVVSGSLQTFIRAVVKEKIHRLPVSNLIGTRTALTYQFADGQAAFSRDGSFIKPESAANEGKPISIALNIGEKPIFAFGNSSGDQQLFEYTSTNKTYKNLILCLEHDDDAREYTYASGVTFEPEWVKISMRNDFRVVFGN